VKLLSARIAMYVLGFFLVLTTNPLSAQIHQEARLIAADGVATALFGDAVAIDSETALIGAWGDNTSTGVAYIFTRSAGAWIQQARMSVVDGVDFDYFGYSVALQGDTAAIGAIGRNNRQGAVYIFVRINGNWQQTTRLSASDGMPGDQFGFAIALDGETLIVGANEHDPSGIYNAGAAYVFTRINGVWSQQEKLVASDASADAAFGGSVAVEGNTTLVGAFNATVGGNELQGAAYIFSRDGQIWTQQAKLVAPDGERADIFGVSVALNESTALIGANQTRISNLSKGSAHVFVRSGNNWTHQARLIAQDGLALDSFGIAVALKNGNALIGAIGGQRNTGGFVDLFTSDGTSWTPTARLMPNDRASHDFFGSNLASDGNSVLIGASGDNVGNNNEQGSAFVFTGLQPASIIASASIPTASWMGLMILTLTLLTWGILRISIFQRD
jgi:hypothetical protein